MNNKTTFINVVSGKGGTGKTLFCSILAEMLAKAEASVLVIDMDVFVRGLTALLYFHKKNSLKLSKSSEWTVSDFFTKRSEESKKRHHLSIQRYKSFFICPSVPSIDILLNFNDMSPNTRNESFGILKKMFSDVDGEYDYIILDSRAGYDEIISATHLASDISICVQEDDDISNVTADNLIQQLTADVELLTSGKLELSEKIREVEEEPKLFTIINKVRGVRSEEELQKYYRRGLNFLGAIPFEIDVMNSFGKETFWEDIDQTLYKKSVVDLWNNLSLKMGFRHLLESSRVSYLTSETIEKRLLRYSSIERLGLLYAIAFTIFGFVLFSLGSNISEILSKDPYKFVGLISIFFGLAALVYFLTKPSR
jgi:septum site-determining protein MinD